MSPAEDLAELLEAKCGQGEALLTGLAEPELSDVTGVSKLAKKIRQELKFLQKFRGRPAASAGGGLKKEHLQCSNLQNLEAIVRVLREAHQPSAVLQPFNLSRDGEVKKVSVDVVAAGGLVWIKVVARNPKALDLNSSGGGQFGQRTLMDQVREFLAAAHQNQKLFQVPRVRFIFDNGVSDRLARQLERRGVEVVGQVIECAQPRSGIESEDTSDDSEADSDLSDEATGWGRPEPACSNPGAGRHGDHGLNPDCLNLDITAMIAYVSALTNGQAHYRFKEKILTEQAEWERQRPVKAHLEAIFRDKTLIVCQSAMNDFQTIMGTLGGAGERVRAHELLQRVQTVPDTITERLGVLEVSAKIKERSRAIFGTGDSLQVATVSANSGFVRAAHGQGVDLAVILHESRALTEDKMTTATSIVANED
eukprot:snap_masked-scaffold995_size72343-processed-gene-0.7 protein:Tk07623 transcript:snap_masked-scaffold995_size72343-processed-gene-0.7-mRNA-1 annotation:"hypothetical protein L798_14662"